MASTGSSVGLAAAADASASSAAVSAKEAQPVAVTRTTEQAASRPRRRRMGHEVMSRRAAVQPPVGGTGRSAARQAPGSAGEDLGQVVANGHVELVIRALLGALVGAPPEELAGVTKPTTFELVVLDLDDQLRPQRNPREVLFGVPAALRARHAVLAVLLDLSVRPLLPRVPVQRLGPVGRQLLDQLRAAGHREGRGDADVLQGALVVEAEQQRADDRPALVPPEPGDDAVRGAHVLDLD